MLRYLNSFLHSARAIGIAGLLGLTIAAAAAGSAIAQQTGSLPAQTVLQTVNDEPISSYDVDARLRLVITTAGAPPTPESMARIRNQVLETLIDERVQLQEAERLGITVDNAEIQAAMASIEKSNKIQPGALVEELTKARVDVGTLVAQIRATIAWRKVIGQSVRNSVQVDESDIDLYLEDLRRKGGTEYLLAEIFIAAPRPQDLSAAKATVDDLLQQLVRGGQFPTLARQYSQAPTAGAGGDMGWLEADQLDPRIAQAVSALPIGQVTRPVEVDDGYYILALRDRRHFGAEGQEETVYDIRRLYIGFNPRAANATKVAALRKMQAAEKAIGSCSDVEPVAARFGAQANDMGEIRLAALPVPLQPYIEALKPGQKTEVLPLTDGVLVMMLCDKRVNTLGLPDREQVRETLLNRRLGQEARRYLRDLRQNAMIETLVQG